MTSSIQRAGLVSKTPAAKKAIVQPSARHRRPNKKYPAAPAGKSFSNAASASHNPAAAGRSRRAQTHAADISKSSIGAIWLHASAALNGRDRIASESTMIVGAAPSGEALPRASSGTAANRDRSCAICQIQNAVCRSSRASGENIATKAGV